MPKDAMSCVLGLKVCDCKSKGFWIPFNCCAEGKA
jgi:hypothetical protein